VAPALAGESTAERDRRRYPPGNTTPQPREKTGVGVVVPDLPICAAGALGSRLKKQNCDTVSIFISAD
jgi:hypothetical protein